MKNELMIFEGHEVEVIEVDGKLLFEVYSTGMALGQTKANATGKLYPRKDRIDENLEGAEIIPCVHNGHKYITEPQLYDLMLEVKTEKVKPFRKWLTNEVLPSLRRTGTYSINPSYQHPVPASSIESATNAGRLLERIMKSEGIPPHEIAMAVRSIFLQAGIDVPEYVVKLPVYEQYTLSDYNNILGGGLV